MFGLILAWSVLGIDPPAFVVREDGEYVISVDWQAYPSDLWIDGYLMVNGNSIDSFHGLIQKYNEESIETFPPYISSRNTWTYLKAGDLVWIHSDQTGQLANTRMSVQKSTSYIAQQMTNVSLAQDFVKPSISFPMAMADNGDGESISDQFTAVESGRYSFTWQIYGTFSCSGLWVRAQVMSNGQLVEGTEIEDS